MTKLISFILPLFLLGFISCSEANNEFESPETDSLLVDTSLIEVVAIDTVKEVFIDSSGYANEEDETASKLEEKYGEQWDFCDCVVKNDSVNKAVETAEDEQFDQILARMDEIDSHCKGLLTAPNTTPEERKKHERKVRKCLK